MQIVSSSSHARRLRKAEEFLGSFGRDAQVLILGDTRAAVDDFSRVIAASRGAAFGLHRNTLLGTAARLAAPGMAAEGASPSSSLGSRAVAARAMFEAARQGKLAYFEPVTAFPGFPTALRDTLEELRMAGLESSRLRDAGPGGSDLFELYQAYELNLQQSRLLDRREILCRATAAVRLQGHPLGGLPLLALDLSLPSAAHADLLRALLEHTDTALLTVPSGDEETLRRLHGLGEVRRVESDLVGALGDLQRHLFSDLAPSPRGLDQEVHFFSAPGEGRECLEIARRAHQEAERGVAFDQMAVVLRAPDLYRDRLESALRRAGIPAFFAIGVRRPDPAGRAFLALLRCAQEQLSARRFAEYLSLGEVPDLRSDGSPPQQLELWVGPEDEALGARIEENGSLEVEEPLGRISATAPQLAGTLRVPWRWEELLVEAAVIRGERRWRERLCGLEAEMRHRLTALRREDPESARADRLRQDLSALEHLKRFALPVIQALAALPQEADWASWLQALEALAPTVLRDPERVLSVLADLRPMGEVGTVELQEVVQVLAPRLLELSTRPPGYRYGRVFVGTPAEVRGRCFRVVFIPGLAERVFPASLREDPLLADRLRSTLDPELLRLPDRATRERLMLRLAVGAASERVHLSYSRLDLEGPRQRVPSFYGLDVVRACRGALPAFEVLAQEAYVAARARLSWPSPADPALAIDPVEHDLAVLLRLRQEQGSSTRGRARYLLELNEHLGRSLRRRWQRWKSRQWTAEDGLVRPHQFLLRALDGQSLTRRAYSASALQRFATCPYQFLLASIYRLEPREEPVPLEALDPLTRGSLYHEIQAELMWKLREEGRLPLEGMEEALRDLDAVADEVARRYQEELLPAIERVWKDEVEKIRCELRVWLHRLAEDRDWTPRWFELAFGLEDGGRDAASRKEPVVLPGGFILRGSIDSVEEERGGKRLRVTDYKTGADRTRSGMRVGGGATLQPVLYGLAVEQTMGRPVEGGRLFFCTARGNYAVRHVPLNREAREAGARVLETIDRAVRAGRLPPAPEAGACRWCDFLEVCGADEARRIEKKEPGFLRFLEELRVLA
ncbi:MAG: PD-(D/E)XK nuclease family protein [Armatimonadetes bacterium]|nr:PD-(D/E)XK nuclease family protein [Armatimonadota bacterium]